jgi:hypothetical protein
MSLMRSIGGKKLVFYYLISLLPAFTFCAGSHKQIRQESMAPDPLSPIAETEISDETREELFQESLDSLFQPDPFSLDTFSMDSIRINGERFNFEEWTDTVRIVLCDASKNKRYVHPFCSTVTSDFGARKWLWHYGVDIKCAWGDTIVAAFDGVVRIVKYDRRGYGNVVVIRHHGGLETIYGHLSKQMVMTNQLVKAGETIGLGGRSGRATGSHLHFEIRYYGEPFDPNYIIDFDYYMLRQDTLVLTRANFEYLVELRKAKWHTVCKGNTLGHIAQKYHTSVSKLCELNNITRKTTLRIGRKIRYQ